MSTVNFNSDNSVQGTITTITATPLGINLYAYNTNLSSLSSYSYLSINNLNTTSTTTFNNLNSLSTNSILSINNSSATTTTIFNNLNSLSTNSILSINGHTTQISNLNATSTTIFNNLNSLSTNSILNINNLNATSTTTFNNLNSFSTNSRLLINNLNNTSTTIFNNLNSLSTNSTLSINNLNATSITIFNNLNSLSTNSIFSINSINATSTTIFNNLNSLSTNSILSINNLNSTSTSIFNKTNFTNLLVSNASTINSSLNIVGNIIGSGTALTNLNYNSILNPPSLVSFNNPSTFISTLNISGKTTLNNASTCISSLNISGLSTFSNKVGINTTATNCNLEILGLANIHNGTRFAALNYNLNAGSLILGSTALNYGGGTNWNGGNAAGLMMECLDNTEIVVHDNGNRLASLMYYEGGATNRLTLGRNMGWDTLSSIVMNGNISCNNTLNVLGTTKIDNSVTCISTLNVSGITTLSNSVFINTNTINNYLFNNTGFNHGTYQDFSAIDKFGYTYIQNSINGPGTGSSQYYSWYIGLGNEYPFSNSINGYYGMQFAVGRGESFPKLSIRRKENNSWTSWEGLTAEKAVSLTTGDKTISGALTINSITCLSTLNVSGLTTFSNNVNMKSTNPALTIMAQGAAGATSALNLFTFDNATNAGSCSIIATDTGSYGNTFKINLKTSGGTIATGQFTALFIDNTGNISCCSNLSTAGIVSCTGALNVTGITTLNNNTIIYGQLSTNGNFTNGTTSNLYAGGLRINGSDYNNTIYQDLTTIGTHSADIGFTLRNYSFFNFNSLSSGNINTNLCNMSMAGISLNKNVTCGSSLNVSGLSLLNRITTFNNTFPDLTAVNNATTHSIINIFPGINGQQGALTADLYNIYLSSFAYGSWMSGPQPYITVNCSMLYNGCNTKMTMQAYGNATGAGYNSKIILNGGNNSAGSTSFINDNVTTCVMNSSGLTVSGRVGINNTNPQSYLHLGNCEVVGSNPAIVFGKNTGGGTRNAYIGYTDNFFFTIGDWGNSNSGSNTLTAQVAISYAAPYASILIGSNGYITMQYGFSQFSDERIKINIKTIENALDKTLLLRGVEYNDFRIEPERKRIGLISQEVELIIPEVVRTDDETGLKSIEYQNLVGLLVEAIKDQQKQINELKNILKNNNLN